jgi:hypothetical protein
MLDICSSNNFTHLKSISIQFNTHSPQNLSLSQSPPIVCDLMITHKNRQPQKNLYYPDIDSHLLINLSFFIKISFMIHQNDQNFQFSVEFNGVQISDLNLSCAPTLMFAHMYHMVVTLKLLSICCMQ